MLQFFYCINWKFLWFLSKTKGFSRSRLSRIIINCSILALKFRTLAKFMNSLKIINLFHLYVRLKVDLTYKWDTFLNASIEIVNKPTEFINVWVTFYESWIVKHWIWTLNPSSFFWERESFNRKLRNSLKF